MTQPKVAPTKGMGGTLYYYTDRKAVTVIHVTKTASCVVVQEDKATRLDTNGMSESQSYSYQPDQAGEKHRMYLQADGLYHTRGVRLHLGDRRTYHDYGF